MANVRELSFDHLPDDGPTAKRKGIGALSFDHIPDEPLTPMQGAGALATGFNRAALTGLPGLPVKTALDVADLGRAAYGYLGHKFGMLTPDEMPPPLERSRYAGSPEWLARQIETIPGGSAAIDNPRPDNPAARILHSGGAGMGAAMSGNPRALAMQFASGMSGQIAAENGADPAWSMVASMGPQALATGGPAAIRGAIRGGEKGRKEILARMEDFDRAGVDPTVGLATGGRGAQAIESALSKTPGGAGVMARRIERIQEQMGDTANATRERISPVYGPAAAGDAIKQGITGYRQGQQDIYGRMLEQAEGMIPPGMTFPANAMLTRGAATLADVDGAPNVSRVLNEPLGFTQKVVGALGDDAAPHPPQQVPSRVLRESGEPFMTELPGTPGGIPFEGLKGLRTRIGQIAYQDNPLTGDANSGAMRSLYAGAKSDLRNAGELADVERVARGQQPGVARQLQRADKFYTQTQEVLKKTLEPIYKAGDPASEKSYYRVEGDLRNSGRNASSVMASLPLEARRQTAATVVDRLGKAAPGQQNADGSQFSPQTFLTNWNRITPDAKSALFLGIPNREGLRGKLDSLAKSAERIRDANKVYSNPSGTAQATNVVGAGVGLASGMALIASGKPAAGLSTMGAVLGSMAVANAGAQAMTNPKFVGWLAATSGMKPEGMKAHLRRLAITAQSEKDPEGRLRLEELAEGLRRELSGE